MAAKKKPSTAAAEKALKKVQLKSVPKAKKKPAKKPIKKTTARATKIDWSEPLQDYLSDATLTLADLAKKYKVSARVVEEHASKEGWGGLRTRLGEQATNMMLKRLATKKASANDRHLSNYTTLTMKVMLAIDKLSDETDPGDIVALAKALKVAQDGERVVLGLPTSVNTITGKDGDNVWSGFAEMMKAAKGVLDGQGPSTPDPSSS